MLKLKNIKKTYVTGDEKVEALKGISSDVNGKEEPITKNDILDSNTPTIVKIQRTYKDKEFVVPNTIDWNNKMQLSTNNTTTSCKDGKTYPMDDGVHSVVLINAQATSTEKQCVEIKKTSSAKCNESAKMENVKCLKTITKDTTDTIGIEKLFIQLQKDNTKINICYLSEKSECTLIDCTYDGKTINISNNTSHLNGEYKVEINNDTLELTNINKEENITRVYSFVRYDG